MYSKYSIDFYDFMDIEKLIYDNGWYRIKGVKRKRSHYFFNDKPIHVLKHGKQEEIDYSQRFSFETLKCETCLVILRAYSKIGLENRCGR